MYKKGMAPKILKCRVCGAPRKVGNDAVAVTCRDCVNDMLRGFKIENKEPLEPKEGEEKNG